MKIKISLITVMIKLKSVMVTFESFYRKNRSWKLHHLQMHPIGLNTRTRYALDFHFASSVHVVCTQKDIYQFLFTLNIRLVHKKTRDEGKRKEKNT